MAIQRVFREIAYANAGGMDGDVLLNMATPFRGSPAESMQSVRKVAKPVLLYGGMAKKRNWKVVSQYPSKRQYLRTSSTEGAYKGGWLLVVSASPAQTSSYHLLHSRLYL